MIIEKVNFIEIINKKIMLPTLIIKFLVNIIIWPEAAAFAVCKSDPILLSNSPVFYLWKKFISKWSSLENISFLISTKIFSDSMLEPKILKNVNTDLTNNSIMK
jgi:hypothetical protein